MISKQILFTVFLLSFCVCFGQSFEKIYPNFNAVGKFKITNGKFVSEKNGWGTGDSDGRIWVTRNGGYDWTLQKDSLNNNEFINSFFFYDTSIGLALGSSLWKTENGGKS